MSAHTPGPWHFNKYHGTPESIAECNKFGIAPMRALANDGSAFVMAGNGDDKTRVALVDCRAKFKRGHGHKTDCAERDANAALIAAAPELLTACEALLRYEDYPNAVGNRDDASYEIVELARAAVKKATQVNP